LCCTLYTHKAPHKITIAQHRSALGNVLSPRGVCLSECRRRSERHGTNQKGHLSPHASSKLVAFLSHLLHVNPGLSFGCLRGYCRYSPLSSRGSSASVMSGYGLDGRAIEVRSRQGQEISPLTSVSRPALGPTQPLLQWVPGVLSPGVKRGLGLMLTTHPI
jgi:hypothetical protein